MELKITECNCLTGGRDFLFDMLRYENAIDYIKAIINHDNKSVVGGYDAVSDSCCSVDMPAFSFNYFCIYFNDEKYYIVNEDEVSLEAEYALDAMFPYAEDSHTFDFVQDRTKISFDVFEKELVIEF